jgi:hypothetical protein
MAIAKRGFGQRPSRHDQITRSKQFTDAALTLDIDRVLTHAKQKRRIAGVAAMISGLDLQLVGDGDSKQVVRAAYSSIYDLMRPSLREVGPDETARIFDQPTTQATIQNLSVSLDSSKFNKIAHTYATDGEYFEVTDDGLVLQSGVPIERMQARHGGCPFAYSDSAPYFRKFVGRIVETYVTAESRQMPDGWLDAIKHSFL